MIETLKEELLSRFHDKLLATYMLSSRQEIERTTEDLVNQAMQRWTDNNKISINLPNFSHARYMQAQEDYRRTCSENFKSQQEEVYKKKFETEFWINAGYKTAASNYIEKTNPDKLLQTLLGQFSWVKEELATHPNDSQQNSLAYQFLFFAIFETMPNLSEYGILNWQEPQETLLTRSLASLPMTHLRELFHTKKSNLINETQLLLQEGIKLDNLLNYPLHRLDIYRYLARTSSGAINSETGKKKFDLEEINKLNPPELNDQQLIYVNIGSQDKPQWILLVNSSAKNPDEWTAWVPEGIESDEVKNKLSGFINNSKMRVTVEPVSLNSEQKEMAIEDLWVDWNKNVVFNTLTTVVKVQYQVINGVELKTGSEKASRVAPFDKHDLDLLSPEQLDTLQTMLVNIGTEADPRWICLYKDFSGDKNWTAFIPGMLDEKEVNAQLKQFIEKNNISLKIEQVDYANNTAHNEHKQDNEWAKWHAIMLGRVLPWTEIKENRPPLAQYRDKIPVTIFQERVILGCLPHHAVVPDKLKEDQVAIALLSGKPFSSGSFEQTFQNEKPKHFLLNSEYYFLSALRDRHFLKCLDKGIIKIESSQPDGVPDTLAFSKEGTLDELSYVHYLNLKHPGLYRLILPPISADLKNNTMKEMLQLFSLNTSILSALPADTPPKEKNVFLTAAQFSAARNRFLQGVMNHQDWSELKNPPEVFSIGVRTGTEMIRYFQNQGALVTPDFISQYQQEMSKWQTHYFDPQVKPANKELWSFAQITQMGQQGLDLMFGQIREQYIKKWDNELKKPVPGLCGVFDLSGSVNDNPQEYTNHLVNQISAICSPTNKCCPVFQSLSLILTKPPEDVQKQLIQLINVFDKQKKALPNALSDVSLYQLNIKDTKTCQDFFTRLEAMANDLGNPLLINIELPEWNGQVYENKEQRELMSRYRALQNKILDNRRQAELPKLVENVELLHQNEQGLAKAEFQVRMAIPSATATWSGADKFHPLRPSAAKELEQGTMQQQEKQQQQQHKEETKAQVTGYAKDESLLITRDNINSQENFSALWQKMPPEIKNRYEKKELRDLFSLWAGSRIDVTHAITKIEPAAVEHMLQHMPHFQAGLMLDNLPPGFSVAYPKEGKGLILCFDAHAKARDLARIKAQKEPANPFRVTLPTPMKAEPFSGDYRQFSAITPDVNLQKIMWTYLCAAKEDAQTQELNVTGKSSEKPGDVISCRQVLKSWAKTQIKEPHQFLNVLFNEELSQENLHALGQLFHHYQVAGDESAIKDFLLLAQQIYTAFGEEHFNTWKKTFIDPSQNLSECLAKDEVDAVVQSMLVLKNNPSYQQIWWNLAAAQQKQQGFIHYAPLWRSFSKVLDYAEEQGLKLNAEELNNYLQNEPYLQAQVFLERLYEVLNNSEQEFDAILVQQNILDNVSNINWTHSGLHYASKQNGYRFWDKSLKLDSLNQNNPDYLPQLDADKDLMPTDALRFFAQRMRLSPKEFAAAKETMTHLFQQTEDPKIRRLLICSMALGKDLVQSPAVEQFNQVKPELINWLNQHLKLDETLLQGSVQLQFHDMGAMLRAIEQSGHLQQVLALSANDSFAFINQCGKALRCFKGNEAQLTDLLANTGINHSILSNYPWFHAEAKDWEEPLNNQDNEQCILMKQLQSIDFDRSSPESLPSLSDLKEIAAKMQAAGVNPEEVRCQFVEGLMQKGCVINATNINYRPLTAQELERLTPLMTSYLQANFRDQNKHLLNEFFANCLHVEAQGEGQQKRIEHLFQLLIKLDKKPYYNELGQVLGLLIQQAKEEHKKGKYYSLEQISAWIESLISEEQLAQGHFPRNILKMILDAEASDSASTLLNSEAEQLKPSIAHHEMSTKVHAAIAANIPDHCKEELVRYALTHPEEKQFYEQMLATMERLKANGADNRWLNKVADFIHKSSPEDGTESMLKRHFVRVTAYPDNLVDNTDKADLIKKLWGNAQLKLLYLLDKHAPHMTENNLALFALGNSKKDYYIQIILMHALQDMENEPNWDHLQKFKSQLNALNEWEIETIVEKCNSPPIPSLPVFIRLTEKLAYRGIENLTHQFETVQQALNDDGTSKRNYSVSSKEYADLQRVLQGIKQKGEGKGLISNVEQTKLMSLFYYANQYSQAKQLGSIPLNLLQNELFEQRKKLHEASTPEEKNQASAAMLACMREILLRKTGKWVNHTQMLDLIYATLHDDESMIHQLRTGEGKSIISIMRVAYMALNGNVVDIFSSKDSLSERDREEFKTVLWAMNIRNAHLTANSSPDTYQTGKDKAGTGAVNFATIGNSSLFQSSQIWQHIQNINLSPEGRIAFIDEADFLLKFEKTQFNYSEQKDTAIAPYNYDEWVYRIAYKYYMDNQDRFNTDLKISRNNDLKNLCQLILDAAPDSPRNSDFVAKYIIPGLNQHDPAAIEKMENKLLQLLVAAHTANNLKEDVDFSVRSEERVMEGGNPITCRKACVLLNNQIQEGASYSNLVQQFLHVKLNEEAVKKGKSPDFFVDKESEVALSSNVKYMLRNYYKKIEGCTGTAGNLATLRFYEEEYGISHIVKLPTHEKIQTKFLGSVYARDEEEQIKRIVTALQINSLGANGPVLITCADDNAVKRIAAAVRELLPDFDASCFIIDTNDSGLSEKQVIPNAGKAGMITFSSRMGRGTDIKPETEAGLMVIRTYPALAEIIKQDFGRQGRNGAQGTCIEVIDFGSVEEIYNAFMASDTQYAGRLDQIMQEERRHLELKRQKHQQKASDKWDWLEEEDVDKYLKTRALQQLEYEINLENDRPLRQKEDLLNTMSGEVIRVLQKNFANNYANMEAFKEQWLVCRQGIESLWNTRLEGETADNDVVYERFINKSKALWAILCTNFPDLNPALIDEMSRSQEQVASQNPVPSIATDNLPSLLAFYQKWVAGSEAHYFSNPAHIEAIMGKNLEGLNLLFQAIDSISAQDNPNVKVFFQQLSELPEPQIYQVPAESLAAFIKQMEKRLDDKNFNHYLVCMQSFFTEKTSADLAKNGQMLQLEMNLADKIPEGRADEWIKALSNALHSRQWEHFDAQLAAKIQQVFASSPLMMREELLADMPDIIACLNEHKNKNSDELMNHLNNIAEDFDEHHVKSIKSMLVIALADPTLDIKIIEPHPLKSQSSADQHHFWEFMAKHQPFTTAQYNTLVSFLEINLDAFTKITQLSSNTSIAYLFKNLDMDALDQLSKADKAFAARPGHQSKAVLHLYHSMTPTQAAEFFTTCGAENISEDSLIKVVEAWNSGKLSLEELKASIQYYQKCQPYLNSETENEKITLLDVDKCYDNWLAQNTKSTNALLQVPAVLTQITCVKQKNSENDFMPDLIERGVTEETMERYNSLLKAIIDNYLSNKSNVKQLKEIWFKENSDQNELNEIVKLIPKIVNAAWNYGAAFNPEESQLTDIFSNRTERILAMKMLHYGLIQEEKGIVEEKCRNAYATEIMGIIKPDESINKASGKKLHSLLAAQYKKVVDITREISEIYKVDPTISNTKPENKTEGKDAVTEHIELFTRFKKSYYFANKARRTTRDELFNNLQSLQNETGGNYYAKILQHLETAQNKILNDDKKTKNNPGGYSRLYDITVQMIIKVANQILTDPNSTLESKLLLVDYIDKQFKNNIDVLEERLKTQHTDQFPEAIACLGQLKTCSFQERNDLLQKLNQQKLPQYLQYIVTNLSGFQEIEHSGREQNAAQSSEHILMH